MNIGNFFAKSPQYLQQDTIPGIALGVVVDNRDPTMSGGVQVDMYAITGDYKNLDISCLPYAYPMIPMRGGFTPPEIGDRVIVIFDQGDRYAPMYLGFWSATPMGNGTLIQNKRVGNEIRPEASHHRDLYPEALMAFCSGNGNSIWTNDLWMSKSDLASSMNFMDVAGKYFKMRSLVLDTKVWTPIDEYPTGVGSLANYQSQGDNKALRTGYEMPDEMDSQTGTIELGHQSLKKSLISTANNDTVEQTIQKSDATTIAREEQSISGSVYKHRQGNSSIIMASDALFLAGSNVFAHGLLTTPRIW